MALNIKNPETERLVRELARRRREGVTEMLTKLVSRELERERRKPPRETEEFHRRIQEIVDSVKQLPVLDDRSADEILGYNEHGTFD